MGGAERVALKQSPILDRVVEALAQLPQRSGGLAIVLATSGSPPAMALLSTGDVHIAEGVARVGIHGSSSTVERLGGAFTLMIPLADSAARVEVTDARTTRFPPLAMIEGSVESVRPTSEPPWVLEMRFSPQPVDHSAIPLYLDYWRQVKGWLAGEISSPPSIPGS